MPSTTKNIYALFVAINKYPDPRLELFGCINDAEHFNDFLAAYCQKEDYGYYPLPVYNDQASRQGIIDAFTHLEQARDGDICIFFYSGHGAQKDAHAAFAHLESDGKMESLVCYDSRPAGRDLMNKELAYLLWKTKKDKDIHLLVVMDCCHADNNTRGKEPAREPIYQERIRSAEGQVKDWPIESFLGYHTFVETQKGEGLFSPPRAHYVQLSACESNQKAKEVFVGQQNRGIFSYTLLKTLEKGGASLSYLDLMKRVKMNIYNLTADQSPVLSGWPAVDKNTPFLGGAFTALRNSFTITHAGKDGWIVDGGQVHGFSGKNNGVPTLLRLNDTGQEVYVEAVGPAQSSVGGMENQHKRAVYTATMIAGGRPALVLALAPTADAAGKRLIINELGRFAGLGLRLSEDPQAAEYFIHAHDNSFYLSRLAAGPPLFKKVPSYTPEAAIDFIEKIGVVNNWLNMQALQNRPTALMREDLEVTFYRLTSGGSYEDSDEVESVPIEHGVDFPYHLEASGWKMPAFRLRLKNTGHEPLYLSGLFLGYNFGVTNQLLPQKRLEPGKEAWLLEESRSYSYQTICLQIENDYYRAGITEAKDYLKILVSNIPIPTDDFNREGLEFAGALDGPFRTIGYREKQIIADWFAIDLEMRIFRPMEPRHLDISTPFRLGHLQLEAPANLAARVKLSNQEEWKRALQLTHIGLTEQGFRFDPAILVPQFHYAGGLSVIEIFDLEPGAGPLDLKSPLRLQLAAALGPALVPMYYDQNLRQFRELKYSRQEQYLLIWELPAENPSYPHRAGFSRKLMLQYPEAKNT